MIESDSWNGKFYLLIFVSTKKVWLVRLGQEGFAWGWGELSKISLKGGGTEKRERGDTKILKRGNLGQRVGALKGGGTGTPLRTMHRFFPVKHAKLLRKTILKNICKRLLLEVRRFCIRFDHFIKNVHEIFRKTNMPYLLIRTHVCARGSKKFCTCTKWIIPNLSENSHKFNSLNAKVTVI